MLCPVERVVMLGATSKRVRALLARLKRDRAAAKAKEKGALSGLFGTASQLAMVIGILAADLLALCPLGEAKAFWLFAISAATDIRTVFEESRECVLLKRANLEEAVHEAEHFPEPLQPQPSDAQSMAQSMAQRQSAAPRETYPAD